MAESYTASFISLPFFKNFNYLKIQKYSFEICIHTLIFRNTTESPLALFVVNASLQIFNVI